MVDDAHLDFLIKEFVNIYCKMSDIGLDVFLEPPLWFMPIDNNVAKKEAAKYFLLAASLHDNEVTGSSRNVRVLLDDFHDVFESRLYNIIDPKEFEIEVERCRSTFEFFDQMGPRKDEVSKILAEVNVFIKEKANGDLIDHTKQMVRNGKKPIDLALEFCSIRRMDKRHMAKSWIYLRWMVRNHPDLGIFEFNPKDLKVPLTTPTLRFLAARELLDDNHELELALTSSKKTSEWWENTKALERAQAALNKYAVSLFPDDPARVDFPFFILGRWLAGFDLNKEFLAKTITFLVEKYHKIGTWPIRYLIERRHFNKFSCDYNVGANSQLEIPVANFLLRNGIKFEYEPIQFWWVKEHGLIATTPPYTPDFLLSLKFGEKKVLLEPHGVRDELKDFVGKLCTFRKNYGEYYYLILIVPDDFVESVQKLDPQKKAYDQLWSIGEFPAKMSNFRISSSTY
jgi:hypothetical protein